MDATSRPRSNGGREEDAVVERVGVFVTSKQPCARTYRMRCVHGTATQALASDI